MLSTVNNIPSDGVFLSLRGVAIANDGYVDVDDIGHGNDDALLCHTDKTDCCNGTMNAAGISNWYFPTGTRVEGTGNSTTPPVNFYRNRGPSVVRLRRIEAPTVRGRFYCQVPNAKDINQTIYVNIGE